MAVNPPFLTQTQGPEPTPAPTPAPTAAPQPANPLAPKPSAPATTTTSSGAAASLMDLARANTITPDTVMFDESQGVEGRVNRIASTSSPLMEMARTSADQQAARRGLLNSSMAVQAGQAAVLDRALPIAQADAGLFQQQSLANQGAANQALQANAQNALTAGTRGMEMDVQQRMQERDNATRLTMANLDASTRERLANIEFQSRAAIQGNQNIAGAWDRMMGEISRIQTDPNMGPEARTTNINNLLAGFQAYSTFWGRTNNVDVSELLNFQVAPVPTPAPTAPPVDSGGGGGGGDGGGFGGDSVGGPAG